MSFDYFGEGAETLTRSVQGRSVKVRWNWGKFQTTEGFPVDDNMINWVIGQEQALSEGFLCLNEWVHKLKHLEEFEECAQWAQVILARCAGKTLMGPRCYLLLLGD